MRQLSGCALRGVAMPDIKDAADAKAIEAMYYLQEYCNRCVKDGCKACVFNDRTCTLVDTFGCDLEVMAEGIA